MKRSMMRGLLYGWLVGSTVGLVYAPRRGEHTRVQIRDKSQELKEGVTRSLEDVRQRSEQLVRTSADRATEMIQQAQALLEEQKATLISTVNGVQAGVQAYAENRPVEGSSSSAEENAIQPAPPSDLSTNVLDPGLPGDDILDTNINL